MIFIDSSAVFYDRSITIGFSILSHDSDPTGNVTGTCGECAEEI